MIYFFLIGKKKYFFKLNNYLIIDYINFFPGENIIFKNVKNIFFNKIYSINAIVLKQFFYKQIIIKKKRRKNVVKTYFKYLKKTIVYIDKIF